MYVKLKALPCKLYCLFLHGQLPGMIWVMPGFLNLVTPEICRAMKIKGTQLREALQELEALGFIEELVLSRGVASFRISTPLNLVK